MKLDRRTEAVFRAFFGPDVWEADVSDLDLSDMDSCLVSSWAGDVRYDVESPPHRLQYLTIRLEVQWSADWG
ncbi:MAG: hypothetical protein WD423_13190 [Rhodothermales bacterium]